MAQDGNGRDRKAAGRPDGGQFEKKTGQGSGDDPVPPEPSPDKANGSYMDRLGRMADDDPEPDDAGRAAVSGFLRRPRHRIGGDGAYAVGEPSVCGYAESKGGHVVGLVGAETFRTLGLDDAALERHGIDRADFEEDVADAISDMVADDIHDNLGVIAGGVAMDRYGVGLEDPR